MFRVLRSPLILTVAASLVALLQAPVVAADWTWTISPSLTNKASCDIDSCTQLYSKDQLTTAQLSECFAASDFSCKFNAIGNPGVNTIPITCAGPSTSNKWASLDISSLLPPFYDSFYSNGSATVVFSAKPQASTQCDFFPYVGKYTAPVQQCSNNVDDSYWYPDPANGAMTIMTKKFELSLYKVIEQGATGYYLENEDWGKCGGSIESVSLNNNFRVVVSMAGDVKRPADTTSTLPPANTKSTTGLTGTTESTTTSLPSVTSTGEDGTGSASEGVGTNLMRMSLGLIIGLPMAISMAPF